MGVAVEHPDKFIKYGMLPLAGITAAKAARCDSYR